MPKQDYNDLKFYQGLGFKSGVEIHQQLFTAKKTFCNCPAGQYTPKYDAEILRHMRPTLSELGEYDGCALMEFKTKKQVIYRLKRETTCTYEMDDTPPFLVNQDGLDIVIEIALLLNCSLVDEMHISRKQYLDGSIPTGFQRTSVVGINGWIPYKDRKIGISHICYEEDACREISDVGHKIVFKTDRLGMPLIEVITYPDMRTPEEIKEVVTELGRLIRSTGKVRRGIGSVRQDVNVSVTGGSRVEIKGVPKVGWIPTLTHHEALRQRDLLAISKLLAQRKITEAGLNTPKKDITKELANAKSEIIQSALSAESVLGGIKLTGLAGILNQPAQPTKTFADEIAGRLRVIACLDKMPNFFHTDKYPEYPGSAEDLAQIKKALDIGKDDAGVVVWGSAGDVATALEETRLRVIDAVRGVPNETRQPFRSGINDFERILPGANRMYPDTDSPPTRITNERIEAIRAQMKEPPMVREKRYLGLSIPPRISWELADSIRATAADRIFSDTKANPTLVAVTLTQQMKALRRKGVDVAKITDSALTEMFTLYAKGAFYKEAIPAILSELPANGKDGVKGVIDRLKLSPIPESKYDSSIKEVIKANAFKPYHTKDTGIADKKVRYYAGKIMKKYLGRINGQLLNKYIQHQLA
ncbi:MAG: Glu-tRNA(Gln) amidotransferase subunit GatE [Candidatus Brocadiia bacterium]